MPDKKISEMTSMTSSQIANNDSIVIADVSENHTKRAEISELTTFFGISPEGQRDTVGQLFTTGTHSGVTVTYDDPNDKINIVVNGNVTDAELGHLNGVTSDIQTQFGTKSNIASPTFTGTASAPTPSANDNSTKIATTGYVQGELTAYASDTATFTNKSGANSQWTNDSGYVTPSSTSTFTNKSGSISQWTNNTGYITGTSTETLNNKTISGSNNTISNVPYSAISGFVDEDISSVSGSHDTVASAKATKTYVDAQITGINELSEATDSDITNPSAGQVLVHDGSNSFDNKTVSVALTGAVTGTANMSSTGAVSVATTIPNNTFTINGQSVALGGSATIPSVLQSGGTFIGEVHLNDNVKLSLGGASGSGDLQIYHNATDNYIYSNNKTLRVQGNGSPIKISPVNAELSAEFKANAEVDLYYNNVKKISTSSVGGNINGDLTVTGTVDGRDVATDGTKLDGISAGAEVNVQADYNATSGDAQILNKPSLSTVATSGSYNDLSNKPTIPTNNNQLTNGANYLSKSGGAMTGDLQLSANDILVNDGGYAYFGNSNDLKIGHDGSNSLIQDYGTGDLYIDSDNIHFFRTAGGAIKAKFIKNGAVELYYSGGKKFESNANGCQIFGTVSATTLTGNIQGNSLSSAQVTNALGFTPPSSDTNTTYSAGTGMSLSGTTFNCNIDSPSEVGLQHLSNGGRNLSGDFTATGNCTAYSDERLKDNIQTIDNALDKVSQMRGVTFTKDDAKGSGVIAQEIEKIAPELVLDGEYKSVAYGNTVGYLIEAIKELKNEVEVLKTKLCECKD